MADRRYISILSYLSQFGLPLGHLGGTVGHSAGERSDIACYPQNTQKS